MTNFRLILSDLSLFAFVLVSFYGLLLAMILQCAVKTKKLHASSVIALRVIELHAVVKCVGNTAVIPS